jgi:hypothetical protein
MKRALVITLALGLLVAAPVVRSGADFVAASSDPANAFTSAADFNTVAVTLTDPGSPLSGTVSLAATASSDRGIDYVRFESSPAGAGSWTVACTVASGPYACSWDTTGVSDGARDVRAVAVDLAGYSRTDVVAARMVDNAAPSVSLADPGPWLQGTVTLDASASDADSGVATQAIEYRAVGAPSWTQLCAADSCPLDTTALADGDHELRASAVDAAGNAGSSAPLTRTVDNTAPTVAMTDPGVMDGTVPLGSATGDGAGTGVASVRYEFRLGAGAWTEACTATTAPFSCDWDSTGVSDGLYDVRAIATDGTGLVNTSAVHAGRRVDNSSPSVVTLTDPGSPLQGSVTLGGSAVDGGSGVASWTAQYRPSSGGSWSDGCSNTTPTCTWDTTGVADALYDLRAVAEDVAGNTLISTVVANRRVDNNGPTTNFTDPGSPVRATVTLTATATDPVGVQSVVFRRRPASGGAWTTLCTVNAAPYTCPWNTTSVANGSYDVEALATDTIGRTTSVIHAARVVDNTAPAPVDVQATNVGATAGQPETGDWIRFTFSEALAPASVLAGWNGSAIAVRASFTNAGTSDTLDVLNAAGTARTNLMFAANSLVIGNVVSANTVFNATMVRSGSAITVTLGALQSGSVRTASAGAMSWRSATAIRDLAGNAGTGATIAETGANDRDF